MKRTGPYVGVTGITNIAEMIACGRAFWETVSKLGECAAERIKFMGGVLVSSKTLGGQINKYPNRYPVVSKIPEIFATGYEPHLLQTIHYNTDDAATIDEQIDEIVRISGQHLHALQLNMKWAHPVKLQRVRRKYPDLRIILQIGAGALLEVAEPGDIFIGEALRSYEGIIDDFLIDPSGGKGQPIDVWMAFACLADKDIPRDILPGIAGGFDASNVQNARGLMRRLGPVNLDAEGRLRTSVEDGDHLLVSRAIDYIKKGVALIVDAMR